ncbi:MAG: hydroxymethylbilane synthase [Flavobacteriaceae bacterium]|nr:hydroxymethylbilane synthase [Flavobacteriaceae bacterium]|tara:strand:+ start:2194 stop:3783 length:1590 start_codon:yes stop_codon:yes gene_type:complete
MRKIIRIGTRDSELALWQANKVQRMLNELGYETEIVSIKSTGDIILNKPIYELGITGVFTKNLDIALLNNTIDIAVHSMKDVPTVLPEGIIQAAVLKRANYSDIIVLKDTEEFFARKEATIATGSLRRKAMWLNRFPTHTVVDLRGNVNTRLKKLEDNNWDGAVFAAAGLERIGKRPGGAVNLSWMISAPAQGAIMVASLAEDDYIKDACEQLNHYETEVCVTIEREFLHRLEGGCTAPIGAIAYVDEKTQEVNFKGVLLSKDGKKKIEVAKTAPLNKHRYLAQDCADYVINRGGKQLILDDIDVQEESAARVFSTKSLSESQTKLFHNNIASESSDFIKVRSNRIAPKVVKDVIENVIITSKNGVEALLDNFTKEELNFKNIFCVGRRTKKMIQQKIGPVNHAEKNAERLAEYLSKEMKGNSVTYFCSDLRLDTLSKILTENKIEVNEVEAYKTMYSPELVSESIDGMLFYSPSAVNSYLQKNTTDKVAFCIGASTAKEAQKYFEKVEVAQIPTVESVIELVNLHYVQ